MTWIEALLEREGFLVSRSPAFGERLGLGRREGSLRFIALPRGAGGYEIWFFVVLNGPPPAVTTLLPDLGAISLLGETHLLFVEGEDVFHFQGRRLTGQGLAQVLGNQLTPKLLKEPGARKPLNRGPVPDPFMLFTRQHISAKAISNDIDAIDPERRMVLELKKPKGPVENWSPWTDDCPNYKILAWIGRRLAWRAITIAYNEDRPHIARVFETVDCSPPPFYSPPTFKRQWLLQSGNEADFLYELRNIMRP